MKQRIIFKLTSFLFLSLLFIDAKAQQLDLSNPVDAIKATRKMQCSLNDGEPVVTWWQGHVFSRIQGERDRLLFDVQGTNIRACVTVNDPQKGYGYRMVSKEVMLYIDPQTKQVLRTWKNPFIGKDVEVVHVANDPVNSQSPTFANSERGPYKFNATIKDGYVLSNVEAPLFYSNPLAGEFQDYIGGRYQAIELFNFFMREDDLRDGKKAAVEHMSISWVRVAQWLPWMEMADRPGSMIFNASGMRLKKYEDLPEVMRKEIETNYPQFKSPPLDDKRPNETSWTYFKKRVEAKKKQQ